MSLDPTLAKHVRDISKAMSLRKPQAESLELLAQIAAVVPLSKEAQVLAKAVEEVKVLLPEGHSFTDFERDFPSLAFTLATGVGKTRLMGAFIAYLHRAYGIRHFFVLAPNLTIYNKLNADFSAGTRKYVFRGIEEFAATAPTIVTGEDYDKVANTLFSRDDKSVHINVFNQQKLRQDNKDSKKSGRVVKARLRRLSEFIGQSYFDYLQSLDQLVVLMDESHRYRADKIMSVLNELRPVLGLELTATPQVEKGAKTIPFKNVVYRYPLANAIMDGYVKRPAVGTREGFDAKDFVGSESELEKVKLYDALQFHENTKVALDTYTRQHDLPKVKPFVLVISKDTTHASELVQYMRSAEFYEGRYGAEGQVLEVHYKSEDDFVEQLLAIERADNPTEIVVHVDKLKEGWDVTNLYTIVPLRAANSQTLVEQSIGRGLRLPFGKKTGVEAVDRLTLVSHDKFNDIIAYANSADSIIMDLVKLGSELVPEGMVAIEQRSTLEDALYGASNSSAFAKTSDTPTSDLVAPTLDEAAVAPVSEAQRADRKVILEVIERYAQRQRSDELPDAGALLSPKHQAAIVEQMLREQTVGPQLSFDVANKSEQEKLVRQVSEALINHTISIPKVVVRPKGEVLSRYNLFKVDTSAFRYQPVQGKLRRQDLQSGDVDTIDATYGLAGRQASLMNYLLVKLDTNFNDLSYQVHGEVMRDMSRQVVEHLQTYLESEEDLHNVLHHYAGALAQNLHGQMQAHYVEETVEYEGKVSRGFELIRSSRFTALGEKGVYDYKRSDIPGSKMKNVVFVGFKKCLQVQQKFDNETERKFGVLLESDDQVERWFRPTVGQLEIYLPGQSNRYQPDFVVEALDKKWLVETKARNQMEEPTVLKKAAAARAWCAYATAHAETHGGKFWGYLLVPHDAVQANRGWLGVVREFG
jgi:type III restriction enzyme